MIEKEFIWGNLHYALDGLDRFSVVSVFPELPYEYTQRELELYKVNVQGSTCDKNELDWNNRGDLGNKEIYYNIRCRTREELFEVHNFLLHHGLERIQVFYKKDEENEKHVLKSNLEKRYYFNIKDIQKHLTGFPSFLDYTFSEENLGDGYIMTLDPTGYTDLFGTLQIRIHERDIERLISIVKDLKTIGYKNMWLYPGREIQNWLEYNNEVLIA